MDLRQPDATTCGSCCAVRARMLLDDGYDAWVHADPTGVRFRDEVLAAHRRTNRVVAGGRAQLPWPLTLGTQPWALARELAEVSDTAYVVRPALPWRRGAAYDGLLGACSAGWPAAAYVGNDLLPRHVVLAIAVSGPDDSLDVYDPAAGGTTTVSRAHWNDARLGLSGWGRPWAVVLPAAR